MRVHPDCQDCCQLKEYHGLRDCRETGECDAMRHEKRAAVICATCWQETDQKATWMQLDGEWSWICPRCLSALNQALPGDLLNDEMEKIENE